MKPVRPAPATIIGNTAFAVAVMALAALWAWPIYQDPHFIVMAAVTIGAGAVIAIAGALGRLHPLVILMIAVLFYLAAGVALAVPTAAAFGVLPTVEGLSTLVLGAVTSWRQLVTITLLPVGAYQALLVPAFIVLLAGTLVSVSLTLRAKRFWPFGVAAAVAATLFGPVFGAARGSTALTVLGVAIVQPREILLGVLVFLTAIAWLVWRAAAERRSRLAAFRRQSGVALTAPVSATARRVLAGTAMVVVALAVGGLALAPVSGEYRQTLRSSVNPPIDATQWANPLSGYRLFYTNEAYDEELFEFSGAPDDSWIRLAVLDQYDGQTFTAADASVESGRYVRIPTAQNPTVANGTDVELRVSVDQGYRGVWAPTLGEIRSIEFDGAGSELQDSFFYNFALSSAIDIAARSDDADASVGLVAGDSYTFLAVVAPVPGSAEVEKPANVSSYYVPDSFEQLETWIETGVDSGVFADNGTFADVVAQAQWLTDHGYPSHGTTTQDAAWAADLEAPRGSKSGHSISRIERLFQSMNEAGIDSVAAIGDDEQFAAAVAMLAERSGFPARVVIGFTGVSGDAVVMGKDVRAWAEAQGADGTWIPISATPQQLVVPNETVQQVRDPEPPVDIEPDTVNEDRPTDSDPTQAEDGDSSTPDQGLDLSWLWATLRQVGLVLLIAAAVAAPFVAIVLTKRNRRKRRRLASTPAAAIAGGWDEYVDRAVDFGVAVHPGATRRETAAELGAGDVLSLATIADRAVFSDSEAQPQESDEYWRLVDSVLTQMKSKASRWDRFKSALSLRSFIRDARLPHRGRGSDNRGEQTE